MPWLVLATLGLVAAWLLVIRTPGDIGFAAVPIALIIWPVVFIAYAGVAIWFGFRRRPRRAVSVAVAMAAPIVFWGAIGWVVDVAHLGLALAWQRPHIEASRAQPGPFVVDDWSIGFAGGASTFLVYDKSGSVAKPRSGQVRTPDNDILNDCAGAEHLVGHYYVCTID